MNKFNWLVWMFTGALVFLLYGYEISTLLARFSLAIWRWLERKTCEIENKIKVQRGEKPDSVPRDFPPRPE